MNRPIVVGVDGSERGSDAVVLAHRLSEPLGVPVLLACCYGRELSLISRGASAYELELHQAAEERLDRAAELLGGDGLWDAKAVATTSPARGLTELAESVDALALVVGSSHRGRAGRAMAGAVGERLIQGAPCAVAVAPRGYKAAALADIGVAYDASPEAEAALRSATTLAGATKARLHLLNVLEPPNPANPLFAMTTHGYTDVLGDLRGLHRGRLLAASQSLAPGGPPVETELLEGDVVSELLGRSGSLDLLALGSRRYGAVRRVAAGAVSIGVLREAHCPVLVLPRGVETPFAASRSGDDAAADNQAPRR